ncbi:Uncharacterised protein [Mycobacteroides abscessus subsp. abscessus]|nr:Uncharacterised protein [Mycobacteroides abscessus subsp. abscessus]
MPNGFDDVSQIMRIATKSIKAQYHYFIIITNIV